MDKTIRRLPDAELEVMQAVWACEAPVARADIDAKLKDTHPMALTTLLTVLTRLADKGFIRIEKQGRSARYIPLVRREEYLAQQSRRFLDKLCGGSLPAFAAALCDSGLSRQELAELRRLLERDEL
ncbi:MAG TPA: BlaI/MecI/CopY family transcriptional regulator [Candidatus Fournierella excrementigallinarum]|nr:BlaI/MecI/CopY family transcriptional regulator [Candidatus Fournierella merdigallinarum]HJB67895.1 BlaI/MecI/CopY family transcriptional regulator [Candidatus Fournierella excrementigallinarum]